MSAFANGIAQGMQGSFQTLDRNDFSETGGNEYSSDWHRWQVINLGTAIVGGVVIALDNIGTNDFNYLGAGVDLWYFSAIRWIVSGMVYNLHLNTSEGVFSQNPQSTALTSNFNYFWRFAYLGAAILVKYILL